MHDDAATVALTYVELAGRLGVKLDSIRRHARRKRWRKVKGNDGTTRVLVPVNVLGRRASDPQDSPQDTPKGNAAAPTDNPEDRPEDKPARPEDRPQDRPQDNATAITALARQISRLEAEADRLRDELDATKAKHDALHVVAEAAREGEAAAQAARQALALEVETLHATLAAMTAERDRWHATANRPLLARLFGRRAA